MAADPAVASASGAAHHGAEAIRFLIVAAGRTGSTRLRLLLDSHPLIRCHGELFGNNLKTLAEPATPAYGRLLAERAHDPAAFLRQRALEPAGAAAVGFKILYHQLTRQWPGLLTQVQADRTLRIIHLVRRNGVKRFLSEYYVGTVTHRNRFDADEPLPAIAPVVVPVQTLLDDLAAIAHESARIRCLFRHHRIHEVAYEDSLDDNGATMQKVLDFLGVGPARLSVCIRKILPDDLRQLIANYDEVAAALQGTPFAFMLAPSL
jgi:hypothetical protein